VELCLIRGNMRPRAPRRPRGPREQIFACVKNNFRISCACVVLCGDSGRNKYQ